MVRKISLSQIDISKFHPILPMHCTILLYCIIYRKKLRPDQSKKIRQDSSLTSYGVATRQWHVVGHAGTWQMESRDWVQRSLQEWNYAWHGEVSDGRSPNNPTYIFVKIEFRFFHKYIFSGLLCLSCYEMMPKLWTLNHDSKSWRAFSSYFLPSITLSSRQSCDVIFGNENVDETESGLCASIKIKLPI